MRFAFVIFFIISGYHYSVLAGRCELKPDPNFPRKHDIRLPDGRLISIVTHTHPTRNNPNLPVSQHKPTLESSLNHYFSNTAPNIPNDSAGDDMRRAISPSFTSSLLPQDPVAAQHFAEDHRMLQRVLKSYPYGIIGVEDSSPNMEQVIKSRDPERVIEETKRLVDIGVLTQAQADSILSIHLTPAGYLRQTHPELMNNREIVGLAQQRNRADTKTQSDQFCTRHTFSIGHPYSYPQNTENLLKSRLPDKSSLIRTGFINALHSNITQSMQLLGSTNGTVKPEAFVRSFQNTTGITLAEEEKASLISEAQELIDWIDGPSCHQSDYNEINFLLSQNKSLLYFVGGAHLKNFKNYLEAFCRDLRGAQSNPSNNTGSTTLAPSLD